MKNLFNKTINFILNAKDYFLRLIKFNQRETVFEKLSSILADIHTYRLPLNKNFMTNKELVEKIYSVKRDIISNNNLSSEDIMKILCEIECHTKQGTVSCHNIPTTCFIYGNNKEKSSVEIDTLYNSIIKIIERYDIESVSAIKLHVVVYTREELEKEIIKQHNSMLNKINKNK